MKIAWLAPLLLVACGNSATAPAATPAHADLPAQPPQTSEPEPVAAPEPEPELVDVATIQPKRDDEVAPLPQTWSWTFNQTNKYAVAKANMQSARTAYTTAAASFTNGSVPAPSVFEKVSSALEFLNRSYAALYYAPDATDEQRVATLEEAANTLLDWASQLDAIGLDKLPKSFRTSGSIALTFEDVVHGPAKRWRGEGLSLATACVARAKANKIDTPAAKTCTNLVKASAAQPAPSKAKPECACTPGDPLCSATMSGWCHPK